MYQSSNQAESPNIYAGVKYIFFNDVKVPIFTQISGGPCSLLAVVNALSLTGRLNINISSGTEYLEIDSLMHHLSDFILKVEPPKDLNKLPNFQKNIEDSLIAIHKAKQGLDLNVYFSRLNFPNIQYRSF